MCIVGMLGASQPQAQYSMGEASAPKDADLPTQIKANAIAINARTHKINPDISAILRPSKLQSCSCCCALTQRSKAGTLLICDESVDIL